MIDHPAFVHLPLALLAIAWLLIAARHRTGKDSLEPLIQRLLAVGVATLPLVVVTGMWRAGWTDWISSIAWTSPLVWHYLTGLLASAVFAAYFIYRRDRLDAGTLTARADINFATLGVWLLIMAGLIGGETALIV